MTPDLPLLDQLRADLEQSLSPGDLGLDRFDAEALGLDFDALTPDDITLDTQIQTRIHDPLKTRMLHPVLVRYEHAEQLARDLGPLAEVGARAHAVVSGNFIFGDFIEAWICEHDWTVPNLHIGTLSLSAENIDSLANLLIGEWVQRLHLTVSDYWFAHERGRDGLVPYAYQELDLGGDRFQLAVTASHAKVTLIETTAGARYVLHGSANLRSSASIEQLAIEHDPELYDFHRSWLTALEDQYHTIHPDQPGPAAPKRKQWQTLASFAPPTTDGNAPPIGATPSPSNSAVTAPANAPATTAPPDTHA
jgi:hypothetical protein